MRLLFSTIVAAAVAFTAVSPSAASAKTLPPGGHYKQCYGTIDHVSLENVRVHCTNGRPADMSFLAWPKFTDLPDGKTIQTDKLKPGTRVHVIFSQSLGVRHVYKVFVTKPNGRGDFGFKS